MFYGKKISQLEARVDELEKRVQDLVQKACEQNEDIDKLYALFANQMAKAQVSKPKPKPKFRPKKDGKENTEATK